MPKGSESSRSFDPSDGLIGEIVPPHQPVTDVSAMGFFARVAAYRRRDDNFLGLVHLALLALLPRHLRGAKWDQLGSRDAIATNSPD
jgi:hypothetical protein